MNEVYPKNFAGTRHVSCGGGLVAYYYLKGDSRRRKRLYWCTGCNMLRADGSMKWYRLRPSK